MVTLAVGQEASAPVERLPSPDSANMDDRLKSLELRLEEQRAISEGLQHQLEWQQAERAAKEKAAKEAEKKPYKVGSILGMVPVWNNGVEFRSPNKDFYFHVGGRTQMDVVSLSSPDPTAALTNTQQSPNDGLQDAVDFRRARLRAEGSAYEFFSWCVEYNFVNTFEAQSANFAGANPQVPNGNYPNSGSGARALESQMINVPSPTDLWWSLNKLPWFGNITIGNQKEPFSLERLISSRYLDFLERNYGQDAFIAPNNNGFTPGLAVWNWTKDKKTAWALNLSKNTYGTAFAFDTGDGEMEISGRMTRAIIYDQPAEGRYLLHVGLGASQRGNNNAQIRNRARGALFNGPSAIIPILADTGNMNSDLQRILAPELIFQWGQLYVQAEFLANWNTNVVTIPGSAGSPFQPAAPPQDLGTVFFYSYYVTVGWFLTGEHKIYDYQKGLVGRIIPHENFFVTRGEDCKTCIGRGAWQVLGRFQQLNLNDSAIVGGRLTDFTFGVNWFWNPNMKVQFNYDLQFRTAGGTADFAGGGTNGVINGFGMRFASDF